MPRRDAPAGHWPWRERRIDRLMDRADRCLGSADPGRALRVTTKLLRLDPASPDVRCCHARALAGAGRVAEAFESHDVARQLATTAGKPWLRAENAFHAACLAARLSRVHPCNEATALAWLGEALADDPGMWQMAQESSLLRPFAQRLAAGGRPARAVWWTMP